MENIINFIKIFFIVIFTDKVSLKILNKTRNDEFKHIFIAIIITTIFSYDENVKSSNNKGFLLQTI